MIVTYHAVESGRSPLCVAPSLFREHLDCILDQGWRTATVAQISAGLRTGSLPGRSIALTFDDGFASVAETAAPELSARGLTATVFCVAGHLGGRNDWPTDRAGGYSAALASPSALSELAAAGFEIGCHGYGHVPLVAATDPLLHRELVDARSSLEDSVGTTVISLAYPYGAAPTTAGASLVRKTYEAACGTGLRQLRANEDVFALPRVDAHYVRDPGVFERLLAGRLDRYLLVRRLGSRARRAVRKDYLLPEPSE